MITGSHRSRLVSPIRVSSFYQRHYMQGAVTLVTPLSLNCSPLSTTPLSDSLPHSSPRIRPGYFLLKWDLFDLVPSKAWACQAKCRRDAWSPQRNLPGRAAVSAPGLAALYCGNTLTICRLILLDEIRDCLASLLKSLRNPYYLLKILLTELELKNCLSWSHSFLRHLSRYFNSG
ncbi:hypothetical protein Mapa_016081 [Marchantia paleacea]|nr:hypothetical protein Mapa_016081 [Marchantia paleacea]